MLRFATELRKALAFGLALFVSVVLLLSASSLGHQRKPTTSEFDVVIKGGTVYDGTGNAPVRADVGIRGDRVAAIGDLSSAHAASTVDVNGLAVAPGFI